MIKWHVGEEGSVITRRRQSLPSPTALVCSKESKNLNSNQEYTVRINYLTNNDGDAGE